MEIKKFKDFVTESISGTMDISPYGPGFPRPDYPQTLNQSETSVLFSEITQRFYTHDDYESLYQDYLKNGGSPLSGFNRENLDLVLTFVPSI